MLINVINKCLRFLLFCLLALFITNTSLAQTGNYYITNYSPAQYQSTDQNWKIIQDQYGKILAANSSGVLTYDGKYWKITGTNKSGNPAVSIDINSNNKIFVGSDADIGYLTAKQTGELYYNSLNNLIPKNSVKFDYVWSTICTERNVFFGTNQGLFIYDYNTVKVIAAPADTLFHNFFKIEDKIFVRQFDVGFKVYKNNELVKVEGSEIFANIRVRFMLEKSGNEYWLGTENGMYIMNYNKVFPEKSTFHKSPCVIDEWMINNLVYSGTKLKNGNYIIGSQNNGAIYVDSNFNIIRAFNTSTGLQDNKVSQTYIDLAGNIWLALNKGISYIELNSPVTKWAKSDGINNTIESALKFKNHLYIGTNGGLQVYNPAKNTFDHITKGIEIWDINSNNNLMFLSSTQGLYTFNGKSTDLIIESEVYKTITDSKDNNILYIGGKDYLSIAKIDVGKINIIKTFNIAGEVRFLFQKNNKLYYGANGYGVGVIDLKNYNVKHFTENEGLPSLNDNSIFEYNNEILIGTAHGIYSLDEQNNKTSWNKNYNVYDKEAEIQISRPKAINNEIWFTGEGTLDKIERIQEITTVKFENGKTKKDNKYLKRIRDVSPKQFYKTDSLIYIVTSDGLYCYDLSFSGTQVNYLTLISSVLTKEDTLLYNISEDPNLIQGIPYSKNDLKLFLAATNYYDKNELSFSYYLEGKDDGYTAWSKDNSCTFSNLHEGNYVFHAKSRDVLGNEGKEIKFSFAILPPWYRTIWAYISYFILFVIVVYVIVKLNTKRLRAQNVKLENTITERTKTIAHQMVEIEHKNKEITDSINYAKGIQDSILPDTKDIIETWKDTFVYFQPKDIVSGDFFWYKKINDHEFLIACADCTGHGVPGGFMSMICSDKLHDSAKDFTEPKDILFGTNNGVKTTLKQQVIVEGKSKDGMEICLLKVNTQTQELSYSGANRVLWIIDGATKELTEIKPTKASIASFTEFNFEYQQHDLKLKKGDIIYATSDGYPDQFGGPEGKKYMSKKMKAFLISICDKPMAEQHDLLKTEINDWMFSHEQVDDLLVIGVRL